MNIAGSREGMAGAGWGKNGIVFYFKWHDRHNLLLELGTVREFGIQKMVKGMAMEVHSAALSAVQISCVDETMAPSVSLLSQGLFQGVR